MQRPTWQASTVHEGTRHEKANPRKIREAATTTKTTTREGSWLKVSISCYDFAKIAKKRETIERNSPKLPPNSTRTGFFTCWKGKRSLKSFYCFAIRKTAVEKLDSILGFSKLNFITLHPQTFRVTL